MPTAHSTVLLTRAPHARASSVYACVRLLSLEMYLSDEEFVRTFEMTKESFYALRQWKQRELKKKSGLF